MHKLGAVNRTQAVATALRERLIGNDPPSGKAAGGARGGRASSEPAGASRAGVFDFAVAGFVPAIHAAATRR